MQSLFESREGSKVTKPISSNSAKRYQGRNIHFFCGGRQGGGEGWRWAISKGYATPPTPFVLDFFFFFFFVNVFLMVLRALLLRYIFFNKNF